MKLKQTALNSRFWGLMFHNRFVQLSENDAYADVPNSRWAFRSHYQQYILPHVQNFEDKRCTALRRLRDRMLIALPTLALLVIGVLAWAITTEELHDGHAMVLIMGFLVIYMWASKPLRTYKQHVKTKVFADIFSFFGESFKYNSTCPIDIESLQPSGIIPFYNQSSKEDYIKGEYKGVGLELFEATLKRRQGSGKNRRTVTVFKGMFLTLSMNKNFKGKTIVHRNIPKLFDWFEKKAGKDVLQPVRLEDVEFEKRFDVQSTDQVEARYLLTTSFMERLNKLSEILGGDQIECSFYDKKVLFKISSHKNRFEVHDVYQPATFEQDIHHILGEMGIIFDMIEHLKLHEQTRL